MSLTATADSLLLIMCLMITVRFFTCIFISGSSNSQSKWGAPSSLTSILWDILRAWDVTTENITIEGNITFAFTPMSLAKSFLVQSQRNPVPVGAQGLWELWKRESLSRV